MSITPIITPPPPPKQPKLAAVPVVSDWRDWWKMHSLYVLGLLAFLPDILAELIAQGWLSPADTSVAFKVVAGLGVFARLYRGKAQP